MHRPCHDWWFREQKIVFWAEGQTLLHNKEITQSLMCAIICPFCLFCVFPGNFLARPTSWVCVDIYQLNHYLIREGLTTAHDGEYQERDERQSRIHDDLSWILFHANPASQWLSVKRCPQGNSCCPHIRTGRFDRRASLSCYKSRRNGHS